jgi:predicted Rossmann-fold nucleotide-binding protein
VTLLGTLEELAEVATWAQLGLHSKPIALLDVDGFWESLVTLLDRMVGTGLLKPASRDLIQRTQSAEEALNALAAAQAAHPEERITAQER